MSKYLFLIILINFLGTLFCLPQRVLKVLEQQIAEATRQLPPEGGLTKPGPELFQLLGNCDLNKGTIEMFVKTLQATVDLLTTDEVENSRKLGAKHAAAGCVLLYRFLICLHRCCTTYV